MSSDINLKSALKQIEDQGLYIAKVRSIVDERDAQIRDLQDHNQILLNENKKLKEQVDQFTREWDTLQRNLHDATDLSNKRGNELAGAQTFLSKADTISGADVKQKVAALNEEIFQTAAALGDGLIRRKYDVPKEDWELYVGRTEKRIGPGLVRILQERAKANSKEHDPIHSLLVQVIMQVYLVDVAKSEINAWDPNDADISQELRRIYGGIQNAEQQPVCGRWRALTAAQMPQSFDGWLEEIKRNLSRLLKIASWGHRNNEQLESFYRRLHPMYKALQDVRNAIWKNVTSEDYRLYVPQPGDQFTVGVMQESYGDDSVRTSERNKNRVVLGTTSMGLSKVILRGGFATKELQVVSEAEVVIESTFRSALTAEVKPRTLARSRGIRNLQDGHG